MAKVLIDGKEVGEVESFKRNDAGRPRLEHLAPADPKRFVSGRATFEEPVILGNYDPEPGPDSLEDWRCLERDMRRNSRPPEPPEVREVPKATGLLWSLMAVGFLALGLGALIALFWL
jgi:hypothetical protein